MNNMDCIKNQECNVILPAQRGRRDGVTEWRIGATTDTGTARGLLTCTVPKGHAQV